VDELMDSKAQQHRRRSIRLKGYDYSQPGAYFVTVCVYLRSCLLGEVLEGEMRLNKSGHIVEACWNDLPDHYAHVQLDAFVIMPNHVHGVIVLTHDGGTDRVNVGAGFKPAPTGPQGTAKRHGLPEIVRAFKTFSSRRINEWRRMPGAPVWQRNYYEHVIRGDAELNGIREYVHSNPARWLEDRYHPLRREQSG
jgi:REP element-mobilizing transposase RayT